MDIEKLIAEVQKRPLLYDPRLGGNSWRELKPRLWVEVCKALTPDWQLLSAFEQEKRVVEAQKRWRTLRDNFKRELKHQKSVEMGEVAARRKKYKHYDLLQFLEPIMNRSNSSCDYSTFRNELDFNREDEEDTTGCEETMGSFEGVPDYAVQDYRQDMEVKFSPYPIPTAAHFDPDEMFFYSMLPAFKRLTERQKSLLKVKITQLMHDTIYSKEGDESTSVESTVPQRNSDSTTS